MNKKIIVSVLAGGGDHYEQMEAAARETCFKNPPENISIYYIHNYRDGVALQEGESRLIDDCFYYGELASRATLLRKCIEFWGYCLENFDFDYIFRPNLGCWVSMDALSKLADNLPDEGLYGGAFGTTKGRRRGGIEFVSGSGFLLSRDIVQLIWDYHLNDRDITIEYNGNSLVDDVAIGAFLSAFRYHPQKGIDIQRTLLPRIDLHESEIDSSRIDPNCHHYYFSHPKSPNCYYKMQEAIKERKNKSIILLKNIHKDEDIYVINSGKSMDFYPKNIFDNKVVVGVNRVCRFFRCNYTVLKDQSGIDEVKSGEYGKLVCSLRDRGFLSTKKIDISCCDYVFEHKQNIMYGNDFKTGEDELLCSASTTSTAIHLAAYMGAKNIYVCGQDGIAINGECCMTGYYKENDNLMLQTIEDYSEFVSKCLKQCDKICEYISEKYGCNIYLGS